MVLGFLDAFVYAHHKHRLDYENAGNFGDCMMGSWAIYTDGGTRVVDGETLAGWSEISRSPRGRIDVLFGPVVNTEAHLAFSGARTHSNNTPEMTAMIEALSFLGPVTRDEKSCIYCDSMHAAGICLGTIQARTHVQLAIACQQALIHAQRGLRLAM